MTATDNQRRELAQTIANQAQALADGNITAPESAVVALILNNVQTLAAWTPAPEPKR